MPTSRDRHRSRAGETTRWRHRSCDRRRLGFRLDSTELVPVSMPFICRRHSVSGHVPGKHSLIDALANHEICIAICLLSGSFTCQPSCLLAVYKLVLLCRQKGDQASRDDVGRSDWLNRVVKRGRVIQTNEKTDRAYSTNISVCNRDISYPEQ